jgi:hypothetical protein
MDYCLDAGDGTAAIWTGPAGLDLDGDGLFDDLMGDGDGDGVGDYAALDLDDDGQPEARYTDDGTGTWAVEESPPGTAPPPLPPPPPLQPPPLRWFTLDGAAEHTGPVGDVDGDGRAEEFVDVNRDGQADRAISRDATTGPATTGYVDTDGDGRWDIILVDSDGDGSADGAGVL